MICRLLLIISNSSRFFVGLLVGGDWATAITALLVTWNLTRDGVGVCVDESYSLTLDILNRLTHAVPHRQFFLPLLNIYVQCM